MEKDKKSRKPYEANTTKRILDIMDILKKKTDEKNTMSQEEIRAELNKKDHSCGKSTVSLSMKEMVRVLNDFNSDNKEDYRILTENIEKQLEESRQDWGEDNIEEKVMGRISEIKWNHRFSFTDWDHIVEAVISSDFIDDNTKSALIEKIAEEVSDGYKMQSPYFTLEGRKALLNVVGVYEGTHIDQNTVIENLGKIKAALPTSNHPGYHITFKYKVYNKDHVKEYQRYGDAPRQYQVGPYYIIISNGRYYLLCGWREEMAIFRLDLMDDIEFVLDERGEKVINEPKRSIKNLPLSLNKKEEKDKFISEHFNMFYGTPELVVLHVDPERHTMLHDYFGDKYSVAGKADNGWDIVALICVPAAMVSFALQFAKYVKVQSPKSLVDEMKERVHELTEMY